MSENGNDIDGSALVFLNTAAAMRLAAAWPFVPKKDRTDPEVWALLAAVEKYEANRHGKPLRASGICRDDGTTAPLALKFIAAEMTAKLPRQKPAKT